MPTSMELHSVSVHFLLPQAKSSGLVGSLRSAALGGAVRESHGKMGVTAVDDVSLSLKEGDRLGILGHNGAGKTTLLRVMASILPPSSGRVRIEGRISALMSINLGMDSYATGHENIRYRARYMGCDEEEIRRSYKEIVEFSELGDYLNLPLRSYSSGMRLRLAFAIATAFQPDIMVLDEWLSAGDASFQQKAAKRLDQLIEGTGIVCLASHNGALLDRVCDTGMVLDSGKLAFLGPIGDALEFEAARRRAQEAARKHAEETQIKQLEAAAAAKQKEAAEVSATLN